MVWFKFPLINDVGPAVTLHKSLPLWLQSSRGSYRNKSYFSVVIKIGWRQYESVWHRVALCIIVTNSKAKSPVCCRCAYFNRICILVNLFSTKTMLGMVVNKISGQMFSHHLLISFFLVLVGCFHFSLHFFNYFLKKFYFHITFGVFGAKCCSYHFF